MADFTAAAGADAIVGTAGADNIIVNHATDIQAGDSFDGAGGTDVLWVTEGMMDIDMPGNIDFTGAILQSIEVLAFNWMMMPMPGQAIFTSDQFGTGLSGLLEVQGAWGDQDITVNLIAGDSTFDASGWMFPSNGTSSGTSNGLPAGTATSVWGGYVYTGSGGMGMYSGQSVGGTDTIHLNGSAGNNTLTGSSQNDIIDGAGGTDTVIYAGNWADYTITVNGGGFTLANAASGTDQVSNVETFQFANGTFSAAGLLTGDNTPPAAPVISNTSDGPPTSNPTWIVNGTAEANAAITVYRNNNGVITTVGTGTADGTGTFAVPTTANQHGTRVLYATSTDAAGNISAPSLLYYQGGHHAETITLTDQTALAGISVIDGYHQDTAAGDTLKFSAAATLTDADFANITDIENLSLTGASTLTLGANALAAGIGSTFDYGTGTATGAVVTGDASTSITDSNAGTALAVNAAAMLATTLLTLAGTANFQVTGSNAGTTMTSGSGDDTLNGGLGADTLKGGLGMNTLNGGAGTDTLFANAGVEALHAGADNDTLIVNHQVDINAGDEFDGGDGVDVLWVTKGMMDLDMPGNLDFTATSLTSIEVLSFNYMKMLMPGSATFTSGQFGAGLSNALEVRGAWGDTGITVDLVAGDTAFDASGWVFPTMGGTTTGTTSGMPSGTATSVWGAYWNLNTTGMNQNQSVGGNDTIHLNGSAGANTITGTIKDDIIDGGAGLDIAVFAGNKADFTITLAGTTFTVAGAATGSDQLTNVERFQFADELFVADAVGPAVVIAQGPQQDLNTNATSAIFSWTGDDGVGGSGIVGYEYSYDGGTTWTPTTLTSVTLSGLEDGANSFAVRAIDASNNTGAAASRNWTVTTDVPYMATANVDALQGTAADEDFIVNKQAFVNAGDVFDGGDGIDTLWAAQGMMDYEEDFDFSEAAFENIEALAFNYMPMPMPGEAVFSSDQFGTGLLSGSLMIYGAWDSQDITVNLVAGNSDFDASGWTFANAGSASGTQSAVWGHYTYTGTGMGGMYTGKNVGGTDTIQLNGSAGDNTITGTSMLDIISGGGGSDTLAGGAGNDFYIVDGGDTIVESATGGHDTVLSSASLTLGANLEALKLTGGAQTANGNGLANVLTGNAAANVLNGAGGNDALAGGRGSDRMSGGAGSDKFVFASILDSTIAAADRILDLRFGDKIDVQLVDARTAAGNQAFVLDALGAGSFAEGHIRQTKSGANLILEFNTDGDAAAEMRIVLLNHGALNAGDFIL